MEADNFSVKYTAKVYILTFLPQRMIHRYIYPYALRSESTIQYAAYASQGNFKVVTLVGSSLVDLVQLLAQHGKLPVEGTLALVHHHPALNLDAQRAVLQDKRVFELSDAEFAMFEGDVINYRQCIASLFPSDA